MCGIIGYTGSRAVAPVLLDGLKRLEYRGYDSAGLAVISDKRLYEVKAVGKVRNLEALVAEQPELEKRSGCGIAHTRWATHGEPSPANAHPHTDEQHERQRKNEQRRAAGIDFRESLPAFARRSIQQHAHAEQMQYAPVYGIADKICHHGHKKRRGKHDEPPAQRAL